MRPPPIATPRSAVFVIADCAGIFRTTTHDPLRTVGRKAANIGSIVSGVVLGAEWSNFGIEERLRLALQGKDFTPDGLFVSSFCIFAAVKKPQRRNIVLLSPTVSPHAARRGTKAKPPALSLADGFAVSATNRTSRPSFVKFIGHPAAPGLTFSLLTSSPRRMSRRELAASQTGRLPDKQEPGRLKRRFTAARTDRVKTEHFNFGRSASR